MRGDSHRQNVLTEAAGPDLFLRRLLAGLLAASALIAGGSNAIVSAQATKAAEESEASAAKPPSQPFSGIMQFLDGSSLHGRLEGVDPSKGVQWRHPDSAQPIRFKPSNLAWIGFERPEAIPSPADPTCRFRLKNGDEIFGSLKGIGGDRVELESWLGGTLRPSRSEVQSITFLSKGYSVLYEGPTGMDGWVLGRSLPGQSGWQYRDGALVASSVGLAGRDLGLKGSASIEFDMAWTSNFNLVLIIYTDVLDRFDYGTSCYMFYLGPGYINAQRVQANTGLSQLGPQAQLPDSLRRNRMRLELRCNKEDGTFTVMADGRQVHRWKDNAGFIGQGKGITFFSQMDGGAIRISNLKVAEWDGRLESEENLEKAEKQDMIRLANKDRVVGDIREVNNGKLSIDTAQGKLDVPLTRITQIQMGGTNRVASAPAPWEVRAFFAGGGSLSFQMNGWTEKSITGTSSSLGQVALNSKSIRQIQFNLERQKEMNSPAPAGAQEGDE